MSRLEPAGPALWTAEGPAVSFYGFPYSTRMAVAELADGDLFVWSPIALDDDLKAELDALGRVAHLVSPNKLHHLYLAQWKAVWPTAKLYASPGLAAKRRDLEFDAELDDKPAAAWKDEIDQVRFDGSLFLTEIVFFHRQSGSALFCDLIQNFPRDWFSGWRGVVARLDGLVTPDFGPPREWRLSFVDRAKARAALARILAWHPRQAIIAHGDWARTGGEAFIRKAFRWLA
jgi:hypothetical protein